MTLLSPSSAKRPTLPKKNMGALALCSLLAPLLAMGSKFLAVAGLFVMALSGCQSLPTNPHLDKSIALSQQVRQQRQPQNSLIPTLTAQPADKYNLSAIINAQTAKHPHLSGYLPISTGADAFATRSILADMATKSIDAQYYIWHDDEAGQLMLKDLWEAAERGVKVRLLLDDMNGNTNLDSLLSNFVTHPNISVRLVNPFLYRNARPINYITNPKRINRRMHNKSMTYDGKISIIGGRNIGDEYLNNSQNSHFADLDVLLIGNVVNDINQSFDDYWQSPLAFDVETLIKYQGKLNKRTQTLIHQDNTSRQNVGHNEQALKTYRDAIIGSTLGQKLVKHELPFRFKKIHFVSDDAKKLNQDPNANLLIEQLRTHFGTPKHNLSIISSYFVPTKQGVDELITLANTGVKVQILTNSYDATDVGLVHSGYAYRRKALLSAGIRIFELKATAVHAGATQQANRQHKKDNRLWRTKRRTTTSLHAKVFAVDNRQIFIGSYNLDPRSALLNSELGVLIDDDVIATRLANAFDDQLLHHAYEVKLNAHHQLEWHTIENGQKKVYTQEPNMRHFDKASVRLLSWLPIEWLL